MICPHALTVVRVDCTMRLEPVCLNPRLSRSPSVFVCMCVCVRARARVCVCVCVCVYVECGLLPEQGPVPAVLSFVNKVQSVIT
jgi:hypothetical protein